MTAPKLKDLLDAQLIHDLANELARADPAFDKAAFVAHGTRGLGDLELTARAWHVAEAMHACLPASFDEAADVVIASLGPELSPTGESESGGLSSLRYMPHACFVQKYGIEDFEAAMRVQYEVTKRFTAEFSIRAYLERYPAETYARLEQWSSDANVHVRRLVSEGTRPRLPWASRLRAFQEDPQPVLALLQRLKDDPARYVQRSVANNLNDIAKDHPAIVVDVCRRWLVGASVGRAWIVKHALRSLIKQGNRDALSLVGAGNTPAVEVELVELAPSRVELGGELRFAIAVTSTSTEAQDLLVDYVMHFVKANGERRPKVFKLRRLTLAAMERIELRGAVSFATMTTRRHYAGAHRLEAMINGAVYPLGIVDVS